jgi:hypothetical protein
LIQPIQIPSSGSVDIYGNEAAEEYDLGQDGAFSDFSILVGQFHSCLDSYWDFTAGIFSSLIVNYKKEQH